jgi:hypothetical protein
VAQAHLLQAGGEIRPNRNGSSHDETSFGGDPALSLPAPRL